MLQQSLKLMIPKPSKLFMFNHLLRIEYINYLQTKFKSVCAFLYARNALID